MHVRSGFRDALEGAALKFAIDNPELVRNKVLAVRRGAIVEDSWELAIAMVVLAVTVLLAWGDPETSQDAILLVSLSGTAIALPWIVFLWSLGSVYVLSDEKMTRISPFGREKSIEWRRAKYLDYERRLDVFVIGDGVEEFSVGTLTKNWRQFLEHAKAVVPDQAWTERARHQIAMMAKTRKDAGPHLVQQAKREQGY